LQFVAASVTASDARKHPFQRLSIATAIIEEVQIAAIELGSKKNMPIKEATIRTTVARVYVIPIITFFFADLNERVTTDSVLALQSTIAIISVLFPRVALLSGADIPITTNIVTAVLLAGLFIAIIAGAKVAIFLLFPHKAVAADSALTKRRALPGVFVVGSEVTLLIALHEAVPAAGRRAVIQAGVGLDLVSVVAAFASLDLAVPTAGRRAVIQASVGLYLVPVVAALARPLVTVAADILCTVCKTGLTRAIVAFAVVAVLTGLNHRIATVGTWRRPGRG